MKYIDINNYDFREDEEFQSFLKSKLGDKFVTRDKFIKTLIKCKKEYIDYLNNN